MRLRLAFCLLGGALVATAAVRAQSFVGVGPVRSFVLPTEPRGEPMPASASVVAPPQSPAPPADELRRLPVTLKGFRFDGEWAQSEWPVYLTAAQARQKSRFRLAFLSAISVMPEGSRLTLSVNDTVVARTRLAPPDATATDEIEIPAGLLKAGFNAVRVMVEQRHRVDCSAAATYELWTALDPDKTGFAFGGESLRQGFETAADIAAVAPRQDGASPIRILLTGKLTPEAAGRAVKAAQLAALSGRSLQPVVAFAAPGRAEPGPAGLDLAIGTIEDLRAKLDMADFGAVSGPRYGFLPLRPQRAPTFVVTGATPADLDAALARWDAERKASAGNGSPAGLRALANLPGLSASGASEHIALAQAGFTSTEFSGRLFRLALDVAMPADFLPADYDRMALNLAGSHSRALTDEARIAIEINGHAAGTRMLPRGGKGALDGNQIFLPLSLMRPGPNRIEITAQVPVQADDACAAVDIDAARRLQILDRSELVLPRLARIGRAPELSLLAAGGFPFAAGGRKPILFVPTPDRRTMAAAATLAARLAVAAGRPIDFDFAMTAPAPDAGDVLMISPAPALDPALMRAAGLDPEQVRRVWQDGADGAALPAQASEGDASRRCLLPQRPARAVVTPVALGTEPEARTGFAALGLRASLPALPFWNASEGDGSKSIDEVVSNRAAILVGQDFPGEQARNLWTVVTAPDAALLESGVECLTHPQIWSRLSGRVSALGFDETVSFAVAGERQRFVQTQGFSLANMRLVAAGWFSLNPLAYVAIALLLVLGLAGSTLWLVVNTGRRQE